MVKRLKPAIKWLGGIVILLLALGVLAVYNYRNTVDFQILDLTEFTMPDWLGENMQDGVLRIEKTANGEGRFVVVSPPMWLKEGSYVFGVTYHTSGEENYCRLYSPGMMDENGNVGVVFDSASLEQGEGRIFLNCSASQAISNLELQIFYEDGDLELSEITMRNTKKMTDPLWLYALAGSLTVIIVCYLLYWRTSPRYREKLVLVAAFGTLVFLAMMPYLNDYLIIGHDLKFHLARINGLSTSIRNGDLLPRINPVQTYGYGYASAAMYPQVFLYPAALMNAAGMSLMNSYKCTVFLIQFFTAATGYMAFGRIFGSKKAGIMGAFMYVLSINRLANLYIRADLGEMLAMIFFPLAFYGMYEIICRDYRKWYWTTAAFCGVFFSHILSTELLFVTAAVSCLACMRRFVREPKRIAALCKAAGLTILLCLWQIVPLLTYAKENLAVFGPVSIYLPDRLVSLTGIFSAFSNSGIQSLGIIPGIGAGLYLLISLYYWGTGKETDEPAAQCLSLGKTGMLWACATLAMTLWIFPWDMLCRVSLIERLIKSIQFPWRLLEITNFMLCITLVAAVMIVIRKWPEYAFRITLLVCVGSIAGSLYFIEEASGLEAIEKRVYAEDTNITDYLYFYYGQSDRLFRERGNVITAGEEGLWHITDYEKKGTALHAMLSEQREHGESWVEVPLYYYPGYHASLDGVETSAGPGENGEIRVMLPAEFKEGELRVWFEDFTAWKIADGVSAVTAVVLLLCGILYLVRKRRTGPGTHNVPDGKQVTV